ncbi:hypothetical protein BDZ85DRAFT_259051 [Elsinoe ampelina]|uniref:Uncharacterized protein n=1 Tax=Elsinoe ampelina TaxID=302913 RepID=A0A6A6GGM8_9PEZI|nr:hypothetical protein BDZ85DRAFT_259051 [Elsinoe ampelina]
MSAGCHLVVHDLEKTTRLLVPRLPLSVPSAPDQCLHPLFLQVVPGRRERRGRRKLLWWIDHRDKRFASGHLGPDLAAHVAMSLSALLASPSILY